MRSPSMAVLVKHVRVFHMKRYRENSEPIARRCMDNLHVAGGST
jgi:hypothetical protein